VSRASKILSLVEAKAFIFYHGTRQGDEIEKAGRFHLSRDEADGYLGISFTEDPEYALDYGDDLFKVWISLKNPLVVDYNFWQGKSKKPKHKEVYDWLKDSGIDPTRADVDDMSKAIHSIGHDGYYTIMKGKIGEMRVFSHRVVQKFERVK